MKRGLESLLKPSTVALIGASAKPEKLGNVVMVNLLGGNQAVYPVNPSETEIMGSRCYPSIGEIPGRVDLAVVLLPAAASVDAVRECASKGVGAVVVSSSGFSESGEEGRIIEHALLDAIRGTDTRIIGPNAMGVFVPRSFLDTLFISRDRSPRPGPGNVAVISQSGAVAVSFLEKSASSGLGISACVCLGNRCDVDEIELMTYFGDDPDTECIAMYLESFTDGRRFLEAADEVARVKPVVLLKSGRTPAGARAARSHTGALASSSSAVVTGAMRQAGVANAADEESLVDLSRAFSALGSLRGGRICVVASAGGFGVIAADLIESVEGVRPLRMAELSEKTRSMLRATLPGFSSVQNPVDLTAGVTDVMYGDVLNILQADPDVDAIMMSLELQPPNVTRSLVKVASERANGDKPVVACVFARDQEAVIREAAGASLLAYPTLARTVRALDALARRGLHQLE